jgi:hypothetical protein
MRRILLAAVIGLALVFVSPAVNAAVSSQPGLAGGVAAPEGISTPLQLTLEPAELPAIVARHETGFDAAPGAPLEEIIVTSPIEALPMQDPVRGVWTGLAAPVWALLHPAEAWRIFLPIPPE